MTSASLHFDEAAGMVIVRSEAAALTQDPLLNAYVRKAGGNVTSAGLEIPTHEANLHQRFQDLTALVTRAGLSLQTDSSSGRTLERVEEEERSFEQFSRAAASIWHGTIEVEEFDRFVRTVETYSPDRLFYPRQLLSAYHLAFARNACNFSVPGAGKTSIVYAAYLYLKSLPDTDPNHVDRLLIVGPLSSFKAWEDEYREITGRRPKSKRLAGFTAATERQLYLRGIIFEEKDVEITLTTYSTLAGSEADFERFLTTPSIRTMMILDEAHNIKREDGYWSAAALRLAPSAAARVVLTGTPAPNGYEDLSNLFRFIYPTRNIVGFAPSTLRAMSQGALIGGVERLKERVKPFYTRITKSDLGLPDADHHRVSAPLSATHSEIYMKIERALMPQIRAARQSGQSSLVRARMMRLRQAAVNPALLLRPLSEEGLLDEAAADTFSSSEVEVAGLIRDFNPSKDLLRLRLAGKLVRDVLDREGKVVLWSYFIGNLHLLRERLAGSADYVEVLTGATPVAVNGVEDVSEPELETREAIIDRFHRIGEKSILIANPQAVGESISLHKAAQTAIYFDRDFNAGRFIQSKDRIHRYNPIPLGPVNYHYLVSPETIDVVIDQRLAFKEQRLLALLESEEIPLFGLLEDGDGDILAVLDDYERRKAV